MLGVTCGDLVIPTFQVRGFTSNTLLHQFAKIDCDQSRDIGNAEIFTGHVAVIGQVLLEKLMEKINSLQAALRERRNLLKI